MGKKINAWHACSNATTKILIMTILIMTLGKMTIPVLLNMVDINYNDIIYNWFYLKMTLLITVKNIFLMSVLLML